MFHTKPQRRELTRTDKDRIVAQLEQRISANSADMEAANRLLAILDHDVPQLGEECRYTTAQKNLAGLFSENETLAPLTQPASINREFKTWQGMLKTSGISPPVAINQLFAGQVHTINGIHTRCEAFLTLFDKTGAIPKICHDCFKVQILPLDVMTLIQVYFALRMLRLPRDNSRKCMTELRKDVPYPYKGYIYCETEEEVLQCHSAISELLETLGIKNVICGISHGCSEYGIKHPDFKYSADGSYRNFERPEAWDRIEAKFLGNMKNAPATMRKDLNKTGISLRDLTGFRTWVHYARLIGDTTSEEVTCDAVSSRQKIFIKLVREQAKSRKTELKQLRQRIEELNLSARLEKSNGGFFRPANEGRPALQTTFQKPCGLKPA